MDAETNEKYELRCDMWTVVKFYCLRGKTSTKKFEKMKSVYDDDCLSWMQVFALHKEFSEGRETVELHSSKVNINTMRILIEEDRSLTCWEMVAIMDCSKSTIKNIMKKLGMW